MKYLLFFFSLFATLTAEELPIQQIMTEEEAHDMGLDDASPEKKQAFERWAANWTKRVIEQAPSYRPGQNLSLWVQNWPSYANPTKSKLSEEELALRQKQNQKIDKIKDNGAIIELKDGSIWTISPLFTYVTTTWQKGQDVELSPSENYLYKYRMHNIPLDSIAECNLKQPPSPTGKKKEESPEYYKGSIPLAAVTDFGEGVQLTDGSSWKIAPADMYKVRTWQEDDRIRVEKVDNYLYQYRVSNLDNGETALANKR